MRYIGLDVGTSSCKASIIDESGQTVATASREYRLSFPAYDQVEIEPETVWNATKSALTEIALKAKDAVAIAVSSIGETMILLDSSDRPTANGIVYMDKRCQAETEQIAAAIPEKDLYRQTLVPLNQMFSLCKINWYRKNASWIIDRTEKIFLFGEYIAYKLCGERAVDPASASRTMFFDAYSLRWSTEIAAKFEIPLEKLSSVVESGTFIGALRPKIAEETGLPRSLKILCGAHDQVAATLGSGSVGPNMLTLGEGTSESLNLVVDRASINFSAYRNGICYEPFLSKNDYMMTTGQNTHGICVRWIKDLFSTETDAGIRFDEETCCPEDLFFLPFLSKTSVSESDNIAPGCFIGMGLTTDRNQLYRAVLEGITFESLILMNRLEKYGATVHSVRATGGGSWSNTLMQLKADILQRTISVQTDKNSGILGLCMIAAVACGEYKNFQEAAQNMIRIKKRFNPQRSYAEKFLKYDAIRNAIINLYKDG